MDVFVAPGSRSCMLFTSNHNMCCSVADQGAVDVIMALLYRCHACGVKFEYVLCIQALCSYALIVQFLKVSL